MSNYFSESFNEEKKRINKTKDPITTKWIYSLLALCFAILPFECLVIHSSYTFFANEVVSPWKGLILAICVEYFYMYFSSQKGIKNFIFRIAFFAVGMFTLFHSNYSSDLDLKTYKESVHSARTDMKLSLTNELNTINHSLSNLVNDEKALESDMKVYREHHMITKGNRILGVKRDKISKARLSLVSRKKIIDEKIESLNRSKREVGIIEGLGHLSMKTWIIIINFAFIQMAICLCLPSLLEKHRV